MQRNYQLEIMTGEESQIEKFASQPIKFDSVPSFNLDTDQEFANKLNSINTPNLILNLRMISNKADEEKEDPPEKFEIDLNALESVPYSD